MSSSLVEKTKPLGRRIASYHPIRASVSSFAFMLLATTAASVACYSRFGNLTAVVPLLAFGVLVWCSRRNLDRQIDLHQNGILYRRGRRSTIMLWSQINEVYQTPLYCHRLSGRSYSGPSNWMYLLVSNRGQRVRLCGFEGIKGLGYRIQDEMTRRLLLRVTEAFNAGYVVRFGRKFAVSDEGIHFGLKVFPWREIGDITIDETDYVRIANRSAKSLIRIPVSTVPNLQVLAELLDVVRRAFADMREGDAGAGHWNSVSHADESDVNDLIAAGFDWDDIDDVMNGKCTIEELLARGPRRRPRRPR